MSIEIVCKIWLYDLLISELYSPSLYGVNIIFDSCMICIMPKYAKIRQNFKIKKIKKIQKIQKQMIADMQASCTEPFTFESCDVCFIHLGQR